MAPGFVNVLPIRISGIVAGPRASPPLQALEVQLDRPVIVEGVSALHPDLALFYDLRIWVESDAASTLAASDQRGMGRWAREWHDLFLPIVDLYLQTEPRERAPRRSKFAALLVPLAGEA